MVGQSIERRLVEHLARRRVRPLEQRRGAGDRDFFLNGSDFERDVEREELLRADTESEALEGLVALPDRPQRVGAGDDGRERILATALLSVVRETRVSSLVSISSTPGTTPAASRTAPRTPP